MLARTGAVEACETDINAQLSILVIETEGALVAMDLLRGAWWIERRECRAEV